MAPAQDAPEAAADGSDLEEGQLDEDAEAEFAPEGVQARDSCTGQDCLTACPMHAS